jgi:hypothetical protein
MLQPHGKTRSQLGLTHSASFAQGGNTLAGEQNRATASLFTSVKDTQLMHSVTVYLSNFVLSFPNMFRQIVVPSSGAYYYKWHNYLPKHVGEIKDKV